MGCEMSDGRGESHGDSTDEKMHHIPVHGRGKTRIDCKTIEIR